MKTAYRHMRFHFEWILFSVFPSHLIVQIGKRRIISLFVPKNEEDIRLCDVTNMSNPHVYSVAPMLSVRNGARAVEFYKAAFGAIEVYRIEAPNGAIVARLSVEGGKFWLSDASPEHGHSSPETLDGASVPMLLTVPNPDAMFAKALAAGARQAFAVAEAHGWRMGRVVDPFGHPWETGCPLSSPQQG